MNKYSLLDILSGEIEFEEKKYKFNGIKIPMIQRDYAHGREGESEIRKRFLKAIFNAIENENEMELDFVYGTKKIIDKKELFIPLDGQQRLTTLYLLNWYIGNRELVADQLQELRETLKSFSYATRASSNKFCEILSSTTISFDAIPSEEIKDSSWFFDSFSLDPTVQSMLVMLDAIHTFYGEENRDLFLNLNQIKFYILPLDGFDLTDELYIKMNARGKQLTQYENFKADLIKWVKDKTNPFKDDFHQDVEYDDRTVKYFLYFELKLDNHWTNLFWKYSKKNEKIEKRLVDPYMMQFWNRYLLNSYIVSSDLNQDAIEDDVLFKELYGNQGDDSHIKYNNFDSYKILLEDANRIKDIGKVFDSFVSYIDEIIEIIKPNWDKNDKWNLFSVGINQRQRIILFATTKYLEINSFDAVKFKNWMRIVWNIINDPKIRSVPAMVGAMRFINELAKFSTDINTFFMNSDSILFFGNTTFQTQLEEEHIKSIFIKSVKWEEAIIEAESHPLFQGNIRFLLADRNDTTFEYFQGAKKTSFAIFEDNDLSDKTENYLWIRALLVKSSDIQLPITLSNGRFNNWRYLINNSLMKAMRLLIDDISTKNKTVTESLKDICLNYKRDDSQIWVYPLVTWTGNYGETLLGDYSVTRKVQKYNNYGNDPEHVYLYNQTRWTDGNILLSNFRNDIVRELIKFSNEIIFPSHKHNIQDQYFRGWSIELERQIDGMMFKYSLDRTCIRVGIIANEETVEHFKDVSFKEDEMAIGWICRSKYDYSIIRSDVEVNILLQKIEDDIFNTYNSNSLVARMKSALL